MPLQRGEERGIGRIARVTGDESVECGLETVELTRDLIARPARVHDLVKAPAPRVQGTGVLGYPRRQDVACEVKRRIVLEHELGDGAILVRGT